MLLPTIPEPEAYSAPRWVDRPTRSSCSELPNAPAAPLASNAVERVSTSSAVRSDSAKRGPIDQPTDLRPLNVAVSSRVVQKPYPRTTRWPMPCDTTADASVSARANAAEPPGAWTNRTCANSVPD